MGAPTKKAREGGRKGKGHKVWGWERKKAGRGVGEIAAKICTKKG